MHNLFFSRYLVLIICPLQIKNKSLNKNNYAFTSSLKVNFSKLRIADSTAKFVAVLSTTKAAVFSSSEYSKIDFEKLEQNKEFTFAMKTIPIKDKDDFLQFLK